MRWEITPAPRLVSSYHTLRTLFGHGGPLTYGYFTFTNQRGTFTGYATPDFTHFVIEITFDLPN